MSAAWHSPEYHANINLIRAIRPDNKWLYVNTLMKSNKQKRKEIKEKRRKKAETLKVDTYARPSSLPEGAVKADHVKLSHNSTYGLLPEFYIDKPFVCRDCGSKDLWTAKQQKWWYEVAKGHIDSEAVRCRMCRNKIKQEKNIQRKHMEEMAKKELHPNEQFFNNL